MQMPRLVFGETSRERELRAENERLQAEANKLQDEARRERDELKAQLATEKADGNYLAGRLTTAEAVRDEARRLLKAAGDELHEKQAKYASAVSAVQAERDRYRRLLEEAQADQGCREAEEETPNIGEQTLAILRISQAWEQTADVLATKLMTAEAERDEARRLLKVAEAERDEARGSRVALRVECIRSCRYRLRELIDRHDDVDRRLAEANEAVAGWRHIAEQILRSGGGDGSYKTADDIEPTTESPEDRPATESEAAEPRPPAKPLPTNPASTASMTIVIPGRRVDLADRTANE